MTEGEADVDNFAKEINKDKGKKITRGEAE